MVIYPLRSTPYILNFKTPIPSQPSSNLSLEALVVTLNVVSSVVQRSASPTDASSHIKTLWILIIIWGERYFHFSDDSMQ